jgi:hypothetical protein
MNIDLEKPMIYLGHPIRGKLPADIEEALSPDHPFFKYENENCKIAIENVEWLRYSYPEVRWYCPGEVEIPVQMGHRLGYLNIESILDIDFHIIQELCMGGVLHRWEDSNGVDREIKKFKEIEYPYAVVSDSPKIWECDQELIRGVIAEVLINDALEN